MQVKVKCWWFLANRTCSRFDVERWEESEARQDNRRNRNTRGNQP